MNSAGGCSGNDSECTHLTWVGKTLAKLTRNNKRQHKNDTEIYRSIQDYEKGRQMEVVYISSNKGLPSACGPELSVVATVLCLSY